MGEIHRIRVPEKILEERIDSIIVPIATETQQW